MKWYCWRESRPKVSKNVDAILSYFSSEFTEKFQVTGVLEISGPCATELASYLLTKWQFWQLTLKWLSGARTQSKTKQLLLFFCQASILRDSCDIGFRVQFNAEFPRRVMNFSIEFHSIGHIDVLITAAQTQEFCHLSFDITRSCPQGELVPWGRLLLC